MANPQPIAPRIERAIAEVIGPVRALGDDAPSKQVRTLRDRLFDEASRATRIYNVVLAMTVAVFVLMLYLLAVNASQPQSFIAISGAACVSSSGLIWLAMRSARESTQAMLLILIVEQLPSEDALAALQAVLSGQAGIPDMG